MNNDEKACPYCAETIKSAAKICRFCNRDVTQAGTDGAKPRKPRLDRVERWRMFSGAVTTIALMMIAIALVVLLVQLNLLLNGFQNT